MQAEYNNLLENWERGRARTCGKCGEVLVTKKDRAIHRRNVHGIGRKPGEQRHVSIGKAARILKRIAQ